MKTTRRSADEPRDEAFARSSAQDSVLGGNILVVLFLNHPRQVLPFSTFDPEHHA